MSNYWKKKLKELEAEEEKKKQSSSNSGSSSDYWKNKMDELEESNSKKEDIAPVKDTTEDDKKWYQKIFKGSSAFDDGYDFGDAYKSAVATGKDFTHNIYEGLTGIVEGTIDAGAGLAGTVGGWFGADKFQDKMNKFVAKDIINEDKVADVLTTINGGFLSDLWMGKDNYKDLSVSGDTLDQWTQAGGQLVGQAALQAVGVPWYVTSGVTSFGGEMENALNQGATGNEAFFSGLISAGSEILSEKLIGGSGLGEKGVLDSLAGGITNKALKRFVDFGMDVTGEGFEEIFSQFMGNLGSSLYREENLGEILFSEEAFDGYLESFFGGAVLGGAANVGKLGSSIKHKTDYRTGLNDSEQAVFDKVYNDRLAEAEESGKKLTNKEKSKIYDEVMEDIDNGRIDIDTIEEALGGDDYKAYQDTVNNDDALQKEFDELGNLKKSDFTAKQDDRYNELKQLLADETRKTNRETLKTKLSDNVFNLAKSTRLAESYNEDARRGQAYQADLSQYDAKQQETIKKAVESGILNNSRRTHAFVDMVAKITADKGVLFDFTNNTKLKESGFAIDGKSVNGYVTKDGVTLNIDSHKSLNSVVGHEIAHVLEGTELYTELQKAVFDYAKSKNDYQGRYDTLAELYKNVEGANVDAELTADLVGDYLFTDSDFVKNLTVTNRNVFQKIYDEVKYLWKVATAGSKEKRQLEQVKRAFENAYKETSQRNADEASRGAESEIKYSVSDKNIKDVTTGYGYGETYFTMSYMQDGKAVGTLEYGEYDETPNVKMVTVDPEYRRKGIATKLLQELQKKYPDAEIDFGMTTPDGTKLLDAITYDVTDENIVAERQKLQGLQTELNDLQGKLDALYDLIDNGKDLTDAQDVELHELGDRWQEVYETIRGLEKSLQGKKATKTFVKYSLSDSDGKTLTKEQSEYFKDSKMRDENGNLKVMYHGSQDAGFHVFDAKMSDDDTSFFFVDRNDVAASYSGTTETYEAQTIHTAEDMNNFIESIGAEGYEVVEKDGKFTLLYEGDRVADSNTAKGIYEEFCWYEGVGEGDANYKVYLNLKNPLVVDAEGRNWDNISREFSQEVADRYNSLTEEERANLTQLAGWEDFGAFKDAIKDEKDFASAYKKLGGSNANLYDLFSIASDNFSAESIKEFAVKQMNTRDYAQKAKAEGYDGVIFKNIHDNGGYSNGSEGASTVAIAFDSNQIKSVANAKPTGDPDIRYSLSENGAKPKQYGNYNVYGNEIGLKGVQNTPKTVQEDNAPVQEVVSETEKTTPATVSKMEQVEEMAPMAEEPKNWRDILNGMAEPTETDIDADGSWTEKYLQSHNRTRNIVSTAAIDEIVRDAESGMTAKELLAKSKSLMQEYEQIQAGKHYGESYTEVEQLMLSTLYNQSSLYESVARNPAVVDDLKYWGVNAQNTENFESLSDADVPPEVEAPYYGESEDVAPEDPFENRDIKEVGARNVKAYMYENPEVKPFFQKEANVMLGELQGTQKGERFYTSVEGGVAGEYGAESYGVWGGTKRHTTDDIAYLLDNGRGNGKGYTYAEIEQGLKDIIEDHGEENNACSKRIEFLLNDRLMKGYRDISGYEIPADQDYINLLNEKQITEYSEEARKSLFDVADDIAPVSEVTEEITAPVKESYEAIKPKKETTKEPRMKRVKDSATYETTKKGQIDGQRTMFAEGKTAKVLTEEPETGKHRSSAWEMFKNNVLDKGMVFEDLSLETGNRELQARFNSIRYAENKAQRFMKKGNASTSSLKAIRDTVENSGKTQQFYEYLYHKHNADRMTLENRYENTPNKAVFGDSVTAEVSTETANKLEKANPEFKKWSQDVYGYMNNLREMLVDGGVISSETAKLWSEMYPHYVPIRRDGDNGLNINVPLDTGRTGVNAPIKRATGGNSDILPLFDTMALRTEQTFRAIARNRFGVELKNTLGTTIANEESSVDEVIDSVDAQDGLLQKGKNGKNPTFTVFEDGKKVTFEITEEMYDALKPTSKGLSYTNKVANTVGNVFRGLLTEYNPVFMATNIVKDVQDVLINSQHATKTYAAIPKAIRQMVTGGQWYQEYLDNGGERNTYFDNNTNTFKAEDDGIKKLIGIPIRGISFLNNAIERVPRLAEYIASREAGRSVDVSMLDAARVTTNFAAGGDVTKFLNRNGFTFLNASMQGAVQQVRNVREAKANGLRGWAQLASKVALAGIPALILNNLLWDDDEEYEELSDYVKQNYYVVAKYGDGKFVRIPKGRTLAVIQNAFEQVGNALTGDDEVDLNSFLELVISNLAPNNPLENNILAPIMQVKNNETWYGEDLVPTRLQDLPEAEQFDESTDVISKWLGEKLDVSPYKINYLLNQYSGGIGDVFLPMLTPESDGGGLLAPWKDKFTTDSVMKNQNVSDFYTTVDELTANAKSSYATDEDVLKYKFMNSISAELSELYKQKREIQNGNLSDGEKYDAVRDIQEQINALARDSLNTYGKVNIDGVYATVGDLHYRLNDDGEWQKLTDDQYEKQEEVTSGLGIEPEEYWTNKSEYDFAYEYPEKYEFLNKNGVTYEDYKNGSEEFKEAYSWAFKNPEKFTMSKAVSDDIVVYRKYASELYDIKADKDEDGKSISGSRKEKVIDYVNGLDIDYGARLILFKNEYNADDTYNYEIIDYLNSREDISYEDMATILKELGFTVTADGNIYWD